jgi:hypothetical protein
MLRADLIPDSDLGPEMSLRGRSSLTVSCSRARRNHEKCSSVATSPDPIPSEQRAKNLRTEIVTSPSELAGLAEQWDALAAVSPQRLPMLSHAWVAAHLECCLGRRDRWLCAVAWDDGRLVGVLPVVVQPDPLLGDQLPQLTTIFSPHTRSGDVLAEAGREREIVGALIRTLLAHERRVSRLLFREVRDGSPTLTAIEEGLDGLRIGRRQRSRGSYISTDGPIGDYRGRLSANFTGNLRKARNKLARLPELETVFEAGPQTDPAGLARFLQVETSGWKGSAGTAIAMSPMLTAFYRRLTQNLIARGWLEWHELRSAGRTVAAHLAVRIGDSVVLAKIAYDEEFSPCAPGNMLFERCLERAFEDNDVAELNCLTDQPWHRNWRMEQAAYHDVWVFPRHPASLLYGWPSIALSDLGRRALRTAFGRLPSSTQSRVRRLVRSPRLRREQG